MSAGSGAVINNESGALVEFSVPMHNAFVWNNVGNHLFFNNKTGATLRNASGIFLFIDTKFTNSGTVDVQRGGLDLAAVSYGGGNFTNLTSTTLTGGTYRISGTLTVDGDIVTNAANITLNTAAAAITNNHMQENSALDMDALTGFSTNAASGSLTLTGGKWLPIVTTSGFTNAGTVTLDAGSLLDVQTYTQTGGTTDLKGGALVTSQAGRANINGGTLIGIGTVNSVLGNGATVSPGHSPGIITVNRDYTQTGALNMEIGGVSADTPDYDQLHASGTVTLGGALNLSSINGFAPHPNDVFTLIRNDGTAAVTGTFTGLPQGSVVSVGGKKLRISYSGGDGNDVVLTTAYEIRISDVTVSEGNSSITTATLTVSLAAASSQSVTVKYATAIPSGSPATPGIDYVAVPLTTLTFAPGETSKQITIAINGDTLDEDNERIAVKVSAATNAIVADSEGFVTIKDDDAAPSLSINDVSQAEGNPPANGAPGTSAFAFTVSLSAASGRAVTVKYQTTSPISLIATPGIDYTAVPLTTLTFAPGEIGKTVTVLVNGDTTVEGTERFRVELSAAANATIADSEGFGTILNDDAAALLSDDEPSE